MNAPHSPALDRALVYAAIFVRLGDRWLRSVPCDATVHGDTVHLDGVHMQRVDDGWRLVENGQTLLVRPKVPAGVGSGHP